MSVGNFMALVRPPQRRRNPEDLPKAPVVRSVMFVVVGMVAALWAVASLMSG